jgi:phosphoglycolate phosphatase
MEPKSYPKKNKEAQSKIILFDLDGTLIDSTEAILESFAKAYEKCGGAKPENEHIKALVGLPLDVMFVKLGINKEDAMRYVAAYKAHYRTIHTQKTVLLPQAKEAIEIAHGFATLGIVTTKTGQYSRELLEYFNVMHYFKVLIGRENVQHPKPDPEPIVKALNQLNFSSNTPAYMIGDTSADLIAAREAKIGNVAVLCGYGDHEELKKYADFIEENSFSAVKLIEKL